MHKNFCCCTRCLTHVLCMVMFCNLLEGLIRENDRALEQFGRLEGYSVLLRAMQSHIEKLKIKAAFLLTYICNHQPAVKGNNSVRRRLRMSLCMECTICIIARSEIWYSSDSIRLFPVKPLRLPAVSRGWKVNKSLFLVVSSLVTRTDSPNVGWSAFQPSAFSHHGSLRLYVWSCLF
jgi:hypothetical protein